MYLAITSRPNILQSVNKLKHQNADPHKKHDASAKLVYTALSTRTALVIPLTENRSPVECWQSMVAQSSTEAEYVPLTTAAFVRKLINEMGYGRLKVIQIYGVNQSPQFLVRNYTFHSRSKHIDIKYISLC